MDEVRKALTIICIIFCAFVHAGAQDIDTLTVVEADTAEIHKPVLRLLDNVLDFRDNLMKCDTMYISSLP